MKTSCTPDPMSAWVTQTRRSTGDVKQSNLIRQPDGTVAFVVDFAGPGYETSWARRYPGDAPGQHR